MRREITMRRWRTGAAAAAIAGASMLAVAAEASGAGVSPPVPAPPGWVSAVNLSAVARGPGATDLPTVAAAHPLQPVFPPSRLYLAAKRAAESSRTGRGKRLVALHLLDHARAHSAAAAPSLVLGPLFNGLDESQSQGIPPDPQIAVSPSFVVEAVNSSMEIFSRAGAPARIEPLTKVFQVSSIDDLSDPQLSYDALSGRFIAGMMDTRRDVIEIAVSNGADPAGSWRVIGLGFGANRCPDQPKLGFNDLVIAFSVNLFQGGSCGSAQGSPVGTLLVVINKAPMLDPAGGFPADQAFLDKRSAKIAPARSLSSTTTEFMVSVNTNSSKVLHVFPYLGAPPTGRFKGSFNIPINKLNDPPPARQRGSSARLDTDDNRIRDAAWRHGLLFAAANDGCQFAQDVREHSCARVMSLSTVTHRSRLQDDLGFVGQDAYYPAVEPDVANNLDVMIGFSSPKQYPSVGLIGYTPHGYTDVQSIADGSAPLLGAELSPGIQRLGDYFGAEVDPLNPNVVFAVGEYGKSRDNWGTMIGSMSLVKRALPVRSLPPSPARRSATYRGETSQHAALSVKTSADGHFLVRVSYSITYQCQRGYADSASGHALSRQDTVPIAKDGSFSFVVDGLPDAFQSSGSIIFSGRFRDAAVSGQLRGTESSRHHGTCRSGTVRWSAHA